MRGAPDARPRHAAARRRADARGPLASTSPTGAIPSVDWSARAVTVLRSPWDYVRSPRRVPRVGGAGERGVGAVEPARRSCGGTRTRRTCSICSERGAPVVPTVVLLGGSAASLDGICDAQGWNSVVVKPAVASGGKGARRAEVGDAGRAGAPRRSARERRRARAAVRARDRATTASGRSCSSNGRVSHALRKRPAAGDYRVQEEWGGTHRARRARARTSPSSRRVCARCCRRRRCTRAIDIVSIGGQLARHGGRGDRAEPVAPPRAGHDAAARRRDRSARIASLSVGRRYARSMLGMSAGGVGAIVGLVDRDRASRCTSRSLDAAQAMPQGSAPARSTGVRWSWSRR